LGKQHNKAQKKQKKKNKSKVDKVGSMKTLMIRTFCALWIIPTTSLALQSAA
jgi:hypothetical protein